MSFNICVRETSYCLIIYLCRGSTSDISETSLNADDQERLIKEKRDKDKLKSINHHFIVQKENTVKHTKLVNTDRAGGN